MGSVLGGWQQRLCSWQTLRGVCGSDHLSASTLVISLVERQPIASAHSLTTHKPVLTTLYILDLSLICWLISSICDSCLGFFFSSWDQPKRDFSRYLPDPSKRFKGDWTNTANQMQELAWLAPTFRRLPTGPPRSPNLKPKHKYHACLWLLPLVLMAQLNVAAI